jgi:DNA-binding CsgD family transcriptional regulator
LLERESEVLALERTFGELAAGRGAVVMVEAPAGLGKTTLLRHAGDLAHAAGFSVLTARGAELEQDFTFGTIRQLLEPALPRQPDARKELFTGAAGAAQDLFAGMDADAAGAPGERSHPATWSMHLLLNGLYWLLVNLAQAAPVVILVDDAQWVDSPSLRFLGFLARRIDSVAVAVVLAARTGAQRDDALPDDALLDDILLAGETALLEPKALSEPSVAQLVRGALGQGADEEFCAACHAVTGGNPLFVQELLRVLAVDGVRPDVASVAAVQAAGPNAVRRHVTARLRRQPDAVRAVARAVAVLGDDTGLALIARQCELPLQAAAAAAERLTREGVFEHADPPGFVHAVVRDVVLALIPLADRGSEHERAAAVLREAGEPLARVASHLLRTSPAADPDRIGVLLAAADQARRQGSPGGAAVYLLRARSEPPAPGLRSEVSRLLGNCQAHQLALAEAEVHLREALALADSPAQRALCAYSLARFRSACDQPGEAADFLAQAIGDLPAELGAELPAQLEGELVGVARADLGRRADLLEYLARFRQRPDKSAAVLDAQWAVEAMFAGETADAAVAIARRALAGDGLPPDRSAIWAAIHPLIVADRLDEAERCLHQALDTALRKGMLFPMSLLRGYLARVAYLRGDLTQAGEHVEAATQGLRAPNVALPVLQATQVDLLVELDRLTDADEVLRSSVLGSDQAPRTSWQLWLLSARARLRAAQGNAGAALDDAMTCGRLYREWGAIRMLDVPWRLQAANALHRLDARDRAADLVAEQLLLARDFGVPRHIAIALRVGALVEKDGVRAVRLLREAVELLQGSPARLELARTLEKLGMALLDGGDRPKALAAIARSAELAVECQAAVMTERLRGVLTDSGARPPGPLLTGVRAFTSAERQVARLAATGLTNRQIAEQIFLSEKTIETHLSRAYRKLGVRSRTQLALHMANLNGG